MHTTRLPIPRSVAVVGASHLEGGSYYGSRLFANVVTAKPNATVFPVNPRYAGQQISGLTVYGTLSELPLVPELVAIASPVNTVLPVLREAAALGVATCVVISADHGEQSASERLDKEIAAIARASGMLIIGPNSVGVMNGNAGLNCSFSSATHGVGLTPGSVAAVAQSGAAISYLLQHFRGTSLGYSWLISSGNEAGATFEQLFEAVIADPDTKLILLFVEGVADGPRFRRAALSAQALGKPVVMINVGVSDAGREAVQSHTGRIAGAEQAFAALAEEAGIVRVRSYADFFDCAKALAEQGIPRRALPHRRRAVVITTSGGAGTLAADQLSALGWTLPILPKDIVARLEAESKQRIGNPVDVTGAYADKTLLPRLLRVLSDCSEIDAIFIVTGAGGTLAGSVAAAIATAAPGISQEIYVTWVAFLPEVGHALEGTGISAFPDPLRTAIAAEASATFRSGQAQLARTQALLALIDASRQEQVSSASRSSAHGLWTAARTLADVTGAGVPAAPFGVSAALDDGEVSAIAERVGYPVALKIDSASLNHKSDAGGVHLNVPDRAGLELTLADFRDLAGRQALHAPQVLVQAMVSGIEVLVGIKRDNAFGPLLVLGLGGTHTELHGESAVCTLLPTNREGLARVLARQRKLCQLLSGYRGKPAGNVDALLDTMEQIAAWAVGSGARLQEADFNPVMVNETGAYVVDARAVWSAPVPDKR